ALDRAGTALDRAAEHGRPGPCVWGAETGRPSPGWARIPPSVAQPGTWPSTLEELLHLRELVGSKRAEGESASVLLDLSDTAESGNWNRHLAASPQPGQGALRQGTAAAGQHLPDRVDPVQPLLRRP